MKIGIDIRSTLKKTNTGIGRYTLNLVNALSKIDSANAYYLYSRKKILDFKKTLPRLPGKNFCHKADYFNKGARMLLKGVDIFHTSSYDLESPKDASYFLTIHDVINKAYPYGHTERTLKEIDDKLINTLNKAGHVIVDSYNTKKDLVRFYNVSDSKISVVYPGASVFSAKAAKLENKEPYILFVGTVEPRKNIVNLIKAFEFIKEKHSVPHKLYIVGMKGWLYEETFRAYEGSKFKNEIFFTGPVSEGVLIAFYKNASVFVYPSFYEGFGFPIVEAFSLGVPVVTSNASSCREIAGENALLIDPLNYEDIAKAIYRILEDKDLNNRLRKAGFERSKFFSWDKAAKDILRLFTECGV